MVDLSRFSADRYPGMTKVTRREKRSTGSSIRRSFAKVYQHEFLIITRLPVPAGALLLELIRQSGLETVRKRDGWVLLSDDNLEAIGLTDKDACYRAARRLVADGLIETKAVPGHKLQYRLNPNWSKPKAEVIDLAARRKVKR